ncbi:PAS domain S-box-containing protein/diguanylate cyclase (GGDEF)-like protein [Pseudonocardia sediminis]|uniref:PAS domain S-box-containing protein/diguanylate cyclase (GGDEF)-like protein n=1 Tax=Pseudonocardia sediminis TaxID=1397368 RepID=A0A4Q7V5I3_PSEST|nr:diguanylate cyclase [Pseudonocardia sediminis]RZT88988.1 PAS domain S-box-containing protein/diguanylate cyclase (GGDEF)-like protein [Pseudonocardia sediminis]
MTLPQGTRPGRRPPGPPVVAGLLAGTAVAVVGLGLLSIQVAESRTGLRAWWPGVAPATVAVAVAAGGCGRWRAPSGARRAALMAAVLLTVGVAGAVLRLLVGRPPEVVVGWALGDVVQAATAGLLLAGRLRLRSLPDLGRLLLAAAAGALVAAAVMTPTAPPPLSDEPVQLFWSLVASRSAAVLLLVPLVMAFPPRRRRRHPAEAAGLWVLAVGTTVAAFAPGQTWPLAFLPLAVLVGTGLRLGPRTVGWQVLVVGLLVALLTVHGGGPFAAAAVSSPYAPLALVQTFLVVCVFAVLVVTLTVAQRDAALRALADRLEFDRAVLETVDAGVLACDADGRIVLRNPAHRRITGVADDEPVDPDVLAQRLSVSEPDGPVPPSRTPLRRALAGEVLTGLQLRIEPPGEPHHQVVAHARPITAGDGRLLGAVATFTDVTGERVVQARLQAAVTFQDAVLAASPDIIFIADAGTHAVLWASRSVETMLGFTPEQVLDLDRRDGPSLVHPEDRPALHAANEAATRLLDGDVQPLRVRVRDGSGSHRWLSRRVTPFTRDPQGRVTELLGVSRDITDVVESEQRMAHAATHDPLTGLVNRRALGDRLTEVIDRARDGAQTPVLFCDLDGFKTVNDTHGHAAGDALLVVTAQRIAGVLRGGDTLARTGGDEFVVVLEAPPRERDGARSAADSAAEALRRARSVARRIAESLAQPMDVHGTLHVVTVSIGIALARRGLDAEAVLRDADTAMYRAKSAGRNRHHVYEVAPPERGLPRGRE